MYKHKKHKNQQLTIYSTIYNIQLYVQALGTQKATINNIQHNIQYTTICTSIRYTKSNNKQYIINSSIQTLMDVQA